MIFDRVHKSAEINADSEKKKVTNQRCRNGKNFKFLSIGIVLGTVLPMLVGCGQRGEEKTIPETAPETMVEETADDVSDDAALFSEPINTEPAEEDVRTDPSDNIGELTADGCGGLYSGSIQGQYYYVWLEMGLSTSVEAPMGTIRLLWKGSEPYAEGDELAQDSPRDFYMGDVDDAYLIKPGWDDEASSVLTIDQDEFGEYSGKIFCFGFWLDKDDSLIYDGTSLRYRD